MSVINFVLSHARKGWWTYDSAAHQEGHQWECVPAAIFYFF